MTRTDEERVISDVHEIQSHRTVDGQGRNVKKRPEPLDDPVSWSGKGIFFIGDWACFIVGVRGTGTDPVVGANNHKFVNLTDASVFFCHVTPISTHLIDAERYFLGRKFQQRFCGAWLSGKFCGNRRFWGQNGAWFCLVCLSECRQKTIPLAWNGKGD